MDISRTAYGTWSGGRFMHFGEPLDDERFLAAIRHAYDRGIRTFMTSDVYGNGAADEMLGRALAGVPRDSYALVGDDRARFLQRAARGLEGLPAFHASAAARSGRLRELSCAWRRRSRSRVAAWTKFDCLMLHNPDSHGYTSDAVWNAMDKLREAGLTDRLGIAPGPANGFSLDLILSFERFGALLDWAMIIFNPLEPWPGSLCLPAAEKHDVKLITRVVDYGGLFHDDVKPGHQFGERDHRTFRPAGWVEAGNTKLDAMRPIAERHGLTMLQLSCALESQPSAGRSVIPTMIQEVGADAKPIETKIDDLAALARHTLSADEMEELRRIGDNTGCMKLKGAIPRTPANRCRTAGALNGELASVAARWRIVPERDLFVHTPRRRKPLQSKLTSRKFGSPSAG